MSTVARGLNTSLPVGHSGSFRHFAAQLYCSGAEQQTCPDGEPAGKCYWYKKSSRAIWPISPSHASFDAVNTERDLNKTFFWEEISRRMPSDRWDPVRAGARGFKYFGREAAATCLRGRRIHVAGDSTTRDTFYELMAVAGHPIFTGDKGRWPNGAYEPDSPTSSGGRDVRGQCLGDLNKRLYCVRDERPEESLRVSFQFLMRSNSTWEQEQLKGVLSDRPLDLALVQCPIYEWFKPDAYNYSKTKEERARLAEADTMVGPRHFAGIGAACAEYVDTMVRPNLAPNGRIFVLGITPAAVDSRSPSPLPSPPPHPVLTLTILPPGITPLPQWTRIVGTAAVESRTFESIHRAFGIRCHKHATDGSWAFSSHKGVGVIDRYAIVGPRRRDAIHPFFNAQFAIVQLVLNHLCGHENEDGASASTPKGRQHERRHRRQRRRA